MIQCFLFDILLIFNLIVIIVAFIIIYFMFVNRVSGFTAHDELATVFSFCYLPFFLHRARCAVCMALSPCVCVCKSCKISCTSIWKCWNDEHKSGTLNKWIHLYVCNMHAQCFHLLFNLTIFILHLSFHNSCVRVHCVSKPRWIWCVVLQFIYLLISIRENQNI